LTGCPGPPQSGRMPTKFLVSALLGLVILVVVASPRRASCDPNNAAIIFSAKSGGAIELDQRAGILRMPDGRRTRLHDCGNDFQTCLTDKHGFAFSFFKDCNKTDYRRLKYTPEIVTVVDNDLWMVFDRSPRLLFHYVIPGGLIGIYIGPTAGFDFRSVLRDRTFRVSDLQPTEHVISDSQAVAPCSG